MAGKIIVRVKIGDSLLYRGGISPLIMEAIKDLGVWGLTGQISGTFALSLLAKIQRGIKQLFCDFHGSPGKMSRVLTEYGELIGALNNVKHEPETVFLWE